MSQDSAVIFQTDRETEVKATQYDVRVCPTGKPRQEIFKLSGWEKAFALQRDMDVWGKALRKVRKLFTNMKALRMSKRNANEMNGRLRQDTKVARQNDDCFLNVEIWTPSKLLTIEVASKNERGVKSAVVQKMKRFSHPTLRSQ